MGKNTLITMWFMLTVFLVSCTSVTTSDEMVPQNQQLYIGDYENIFNAAKHAVIDLRWELVSASHEDGILKAHIPMNMITNEDNLTITFFSAPDGKTEVKVRSTSPQMIDWGKGKKNIQQFYKNLDSQLVSERSK